MGFGLTKRQAKDIQVEDYLFIHDIIFGEVNCELDASCPSGTFEKVTKVEELGGGLIMFYYSSGARFKKASSHLSILNLTN